MDNITETTILLDDSKFYRLTDAAKTPLETGEVLGLKSGYSLVIDDSELFYTGMDFPQAPKSKLHMFIQNYLSAAYPQEAIQSFGYIKKGDSILISLFKPGYFDNEGYKKIFERAGKVTSPLAIKYATNDTFAYTYGDTTIEVEDGLLTHIEKQGQNTPKLYKTVNHCSMTLPFLKMKSASPSQFLAPAIVFVIAFLLFVAGSYFRLSTHETQLMKAQNVLNRIYTHAGVANSPDPMGMLMAKAKNSSGAGSYKNMFILEKISKAQSDNITATSIEILNGSVTYIGTTNDYAYIEAFRKQLKEITGADVTLLDTKKTDNGITFTVRFQQ